MNNHHDSAHEFCLYVPDLAELLRGGSGRYTTRNAEIVHRIVHVLRFHAGDPFILFDRHMHIRCSFVSATRADITFDVLALQKTEAPSPSLTLVIGLLKKDALTDVVERATQLGVNCVQPVLTEKVQRPWGGPAEHDRLERVVVAAASQSKNFALTSIRSPISFDEFIQRAAADESTKLLCSPDGDPIITMICTEPIGTRSVSVCVGPEGGFVDRECQQLIEVGYRSCRLTNTTLRSIEAAALIAGIIRCV